MPGRASEQAVGGEVMASVDTTGNGPRLILADISSDESWISVQEDAAADVVEWR